MMETMETLAQVFRRHVGSMVQNRRRRNQMRGRPEEHAQGLCWYLYEFGRHRTHRGFVFVARALVAVQSPRRDIHVDGDDDDGRGRGDGFGLDDDDDAVVQSDDVRLVDGVRDGGGYREYDVELGRGMEAKLKSLYACLQNGVV